jgi:hypothetical protein
MLIEQIRKEIKAPRVVKQKAWGRESEKKKGKRGLGIAVAWPTKKKKKRMSMLKNRKRERKGKQGVYGAQRDRYGYG